jgi:hypothetical protein
MLVHVMVYDAKTGEYIERVTCEDDTPWVEIWKRDLQKIRESVANS